TASGTDRRDELTTTDRGDLKTKPVEKPAPGAKVVRGFNILREVGCFGCHEIAGRKGGRDVGPDLRLEPTPPLESLPPAERAPAHPATAPAPSRKVAPTRARLSEKTNEEWTRRWLKSPRSFRPDTRMPNFCGLSNNDRKALPDDQKDFPDAEVAAVAHVLFEESRGYLKEVEKFHARPEKDRRADEDRLKELRGRSKLTDAEKKELGEVARRVQLGVDPLPLTNKAYDPQLPKDYKEDKVRGRQLFSEKGCRACHAHQGTTAAHGKPADKDYTPAVDSKAAFGPDLSQVSGKLGTKAGDPKTARRWLVQWLKDPHVHSPRSYMPVTH